MSNHRRQFLRFAQYNSWFNDRLFELVATLDDAERQRNRGAFFGSIHATLDHILLCDRLWLGRIAKSDLPFPSLDAADLVLDLNSLDQGVAADFDLLISERKATDAVLEAFVRELTPELLGRDVAYKNSKGIDFSNPVWHVVAHVFNHQTHHRGQVTTLLFQLGLDPGMTDFMVTALMPLEE